MKSLNIRSLAFALLSLTVSAPSLRAANVGVTVGSNFFAPQSVRINLGDTVVWTWSSGTHSVTSDTGAWDSGVKSTPANFSHQFNNAGDFPYYCSVHSSAGGSAQNGVVHVQATDSVPSNEKVTQVNLVSDLAGHAPRVNTKIVNPWGILSGPEGIWVAENGKGALSELNAAGVALTSLTVPGAGGSTNASPPTGLAWNKTSDFVITNGTKHAPSEFIFATEDGTVGGWSRRVNAKSPIVVFDNSSSGAVYKGIALAKGTNGNLIFAANFHAGVVDVLDRHFQPVQSFTDPALQALGFAPFNIRPINGKLFVTFAAQKLPDRHDDQSGPGNGYIDIFDTDGTLLRAFASQGSLNSPWGLVVAPSHFGKFSHALLVGNFGDGTINAYDLITGQNLGSLKDATGVPVAISGLWGLEFDRQANEGFFDFEATRLYFTAGINGESDGLFGFLRAVNPFSR